MKTWGVRIKLQREQQQYEAALALVQSGAKDGELYIDKLHHKEKAIYHSHRYERRRESYLLGRLAAKQAIITLTENDRPDTFWIDSGVFQFPVVRGGNLQNIQVSISHCRGLGFCVAFPEAHPMAVDVEKINPANAEVVASQLTNDEKLLLEKHQSIIDYTTIFSIKEALSKILRTGMMLEFHFLEIDTVEFEEECVLCTFKNFGQYKSYAYTKDNFVFSLVLPRKTKIDLRDAWQILDILKIVENP